MSILKVIKDIELTNSNPYNECSYCYYILRKDNIIYQNGKRGYSIAPTKNKKAQHINLNVNVILKYPECFSSLTEKELFKFFPHANGNKFIDKIKNFLNAQVFNSGAREHALDALKEFGWILDKGTQKFTKYNESSRQYYIEKERMNRLKMIHDEIRRKLLIEKTIKPQSARQRFNKYVRHLYGN